MAASTGGAVKAFIESLGLGVPVFRDQLPRTAPDAPAQAPPYIVVQEGISISPDVQGDFGDLSSPDFVTELVQVDLYQQKYDADQQRAEVLDLAERLARGFRGGSLTAAPTRVYGMTLDSMVRLLDPAANLVHHALTVRLRRVL